jgi:paraquat-inducible protein B
MNRPAALRVGLFALVGTALLLAAVLWVSRDWFGATETLRLQFDGSVYGLQAGAPVVMRGVRVGHVQGVGLGQGPQVPVTAQVDRAALAPLLGAADDGAPVLPRLVQAGLVAQLQTQSLLTGLLYVDLDLDPARASATLPTPMHGAVEVPTRTAGLAALQAQLASLDLAQLGADLSAAVAGARRLVEQPEADQALARAARAAARLEALAAQLERDTARLAGRAEGLLADGRRAVAELSPAAAGALREVSSAASSAGRAAEQLRGDGTQALDAVRRAGGQLERAAGELATLAAADGRLAQDASRALGEVSRAAHALRELAELLDRHPDALLRGRAPSPEPEAR